MDPTATLKIIREAIQTMLAAGDLGMECPAQTLASAVHSLDQWMQAGGFLPDQWESVEGHIDDFTLAQERAIRRLYARTDARADFAKFRLLFSQYPALGCAGGMVGGIFYGIESGGYCHT